MRLITSLFLCLVMGSATAQVQPQWFTILGDPDDGKTDTLQLDVARVPKPGELGLMDLRVNLAVTRTMPDGERYSSYTSRILIECDKASIVHLDQTRFLRQNWSGPATFEKFYELRPMAFGGLQPNPSATILRAACRTGPP